jgi:hypothetical protein
MVIDNLSEKYYSYSPFAYSANNPIRFVDPDGNSWWDVIKGAGAAIADNAVGGMSDRRETTSYIDPSDYNLGQDIGDGLSIVLGALETAAGITITGGGTAATIASGGTASPVSVPIAIEGTVIAAHGATMTSAATANAMNQKGRVDESSEISSSNDSNAKKGKGSTKNEQKINQNRKESWSQKEASARQEMKDARVNGATKKEKAAIQKQIDHAVNQQKTSENHANGNKR